MADHAGTAGAVDHVEGLSKVLLQQRRDDARGRVSAAARAPRHDHGYGARGIGLRRARLEPQAGNSGGSGSGSRERAARNPGHVDPPAAPVKLALDYDAGILGKFALRSQGDAVSSTHSEIGWVSRIGGAMIAIIIGSKT